MRVHLGAWWCVVGCALAGLAFFGTANAAFASEYHVTELGGGTGEVTYKIGTKTEGKISYNASDWSHLKARYGDVAVEDAGQKAVADPIGSVASDAEHAKKVLESEWGTEAKGVETFGNASRAQLEVDSGFEALEAADGLAPSTSLLMSAVNGAPLAVGAFALGWEIGTFITGGESIADLLGLEGGEKAPGSETEKGEIRVVVPGSTWSKTHSKCEPEVPSLDVCVGDPIKVGEFSGESVEVAVPEGALWIDWHSEFSAWDSRFGWPEGGVGPEICSAFRPKLQLEPLATVFGHGEVGCGHFAGEVVFNDLRGGQAVKYLALPKPKLKEGHITETARTKITAGSSSRPEVKGAISAPNIVTQPAPSVVKVAVESPDLGTKEGTVPDPALPEIPEVLPTETGTQYKEKVEVAGFTSVKLDTVSETLANPRVKPEGVIKVEPSPGTRTMSTTKVEVEQNPSVTPVVGGGVTPPTLPGIKLPKIEALCTNFPFGVPCWIVEAVEAWSGTGETPEIGWGEIEIHGVKIPGAKVSLAPLNPLMAKVRPFMILFATIGLVVLFYRFATGTNAERTGATEHPTHSSVGEEPGEGIL